MRLLTVRRMFYESGSRFRIVFNYLGIKSVTRKKRERC